MDDFEDYEPGDLTEATGEVWEGSGTTSIVEEDGLLFLNYGGDGTTTRAVRDLGEENFLTDGATGTYFFRMRRNEETVDNSMGFAETADTGSGFNVYLPQARVIGSGLSVRNGGGFDDGLGDVEVGVWNNVWMVVNMDSGTWDLYFSQEFDDAELIQADIAFRTAGDSIQTVFFIAASGGGPISIDDIYFTPDIDTSNPIVDLEFFQFVQHPRDAAVFVGEEVAFGARAAGGDGEGEVSYLWEVSSDEGETWTEVEEGAEGNSLTIESASFDQSGNLYRVEASRDGETVVSDEATLTVTFPDPVILQGIPAAVTVREGAEFAYTVEAEGLGNISYQWQLDGEDIDGETGPTLELAAAAAGTYSVVVSDDAATEEGLDPTSVTLTSVLSTLDVPAPERAISLNFVGTSSSGTTWSDELGVMEPGEEAGVLPVANWNNSADETGVATRATPLELAENIGTEAAAVATWNSANTWAARNAGGALEDKDADQRLFHGYIEGRDGSSVTISDVPYTTYDVYVYPMGVEGPSGEWIRSLTLTEDEGAATTLFMRNFSGNPPEPFFPFVQSTATSVEEAEAAEPATFVRFAGVSGGGFTIDHQDEVGGNLGGLGAVSIIDTTPEGTAYPPLITSRPSDRFVPGGSTVTLAVEAQSQNPGGTLSYEWRRDGENVSGGGEAMLTLEDATADDTGIYTVEITDTSDLGTTSRTVEASVVVAGENRFALLNVDMNVAGDPMSGDGMLLPDGLQDWVQAANDADNPMNIGEGDSLWNSLPGQTGTMTYENLVDSEGLALPGLTFTVEGATGVEDALGGGLEDPPDLFSASLLRDYVFTEGEDEMTLTVGGLNAFAGLEVTLVVYALGKDSRSWPNADGNTPDQNDVATVTLAEANDESGQEPVVTDQTEGREVRWNEFSFAAFDARVAANGTVSWTVGPVDGEPGLNAFNGFQILITNQGEAVEPEGIADWRQTHFGTTSNEGDAANDADPDGGGLKNLAEYAVGSDPNDGTDDFSSVVRGQDGDFLTLTFDHIADANLSYAIEATNDLNGTWTEVENYGSFGTSGTETFTDSESIGANPNRFLRLKVTVTE